MDNDFEYAGNCSVCSDPVDLNDQGCCGECGGVFHWGHCGEWGDTAHECAECSNNE